MTDINETDAPAKPHVKRPAGARRKRKTNFIDRMAVTTALRNYRIMAWIVGVPLAVLILVAVPLKYFGNNPTPVTVIGVAHGYLYLIFIITAVMLSIKRRWDFKRTIIVILCGTIPLLSFYTEHVVHKNVLAGKPGW
ncbi:integral membrane protein [Antricoccus suffuscus]|uniref:Integral membrane protein n=1 Tax=Antricoccus suffuscus TaxID=1629062 RepID=A0A2T1A3J2_9ACTN|nr:DUF3817 domain-containing protein [Antricoccus suffuscus]PRZ43156.1 integral membrane protein [Antricoccus suffuscus]